MARSRATIQAMRRYPRYVILPHLAIFYSASSLLYAMAAMAPARTNENVALINKVIICAPSALPLVFRRPFPSDVRRSPIRALMYDAFLQREIALDEYAGAYYINGARAGGKNATEVAQAVDGLDEEDRESGGGKWARLWWGDTVNRWRDEKQVAMMRKSE